jgi:zinc transport system substrate-binding protein
MFAITGCGIYTDTINNNEKINIVCTTFPQYDWASNMIKGNEDNVSLTLLMDKGGDLHNFQPSALDIAKVSGCDIFIYVGGESDNWVNDALKEAVNPNVIAVNMIEALEEYGNLYEEDNVQAEHVQTKHIHSGHAEETTHSEHSHNEYDEHVWLSLRNAIILNEYICEALSNADYENTALYKDNCNNYIAELLALDKQYTNIVKTSPQNTLLFADRFPFRYMVEDYGLNYYAAFEGCSAETEASFNTVAFLSDKLSELELSSVAVIDGSDKRLAQVIIENSNNADRDIVVFNSMQSISKNDIENGVTYITAMQENLEALKQALSGK